MKEKKLVHNVFFTLKDPSDKEVERLIEECYKYLKDLPGIIYFSAGRLVAEHDREVNVTDFHVGLHVVFENKDHHDQYQVSEKHNIFLERNKDNWLEVLVYDTYVR